ncbi:MAG: S-layer homology domain-containing protein, partial [bacterium]
QGVYIDNTAVKTINASSVTSSSFTVEAKSVTNVEVSAKVTEISVETEANSISVEGESVEVVEVSGNATSVEIETGAESIAVAGENVIEASVGGSNLTTITVEAPELTNLDVTDASEGDSLTLEVVGESSIENISLSGGATSGGLDVDNSQGESDLEFNVETKDEEGNTTGSDDFAVEEGDKENVDVDDLIDKEESQTTTSKPSNSGSSSSSSSGSGSSSSGSASLGSASSSSSSSSNTTTSTTESNTESTTLDTTTSIIIPEVEEEKNPSETLKFEVSDVEVDYKLFDVFTKFTDLNNDMTNWANDSIAFGLAQGYLYSESETEFKPSENVSRAMMVKVLSNMVQNIDGYTYEEGTFVDVQVDDYYSSAVAWAVEKEITNGTTLTQFSPNDDVERQQMAVLFVRFADSLGVELPKLSDEVAFLDEISIYDYAKENIKTLQQADIVQGDENGFRPTDPITKAEFATMVENFVNLLASSQE